MLLSSKHSDYQASANKEKTNKFYDREPPCRTSSWVLKLSSFIIFFTFITEPTPSPHLYSHAAVASEISECSIHGKDILKKGGNSVDAAITTMLCVGSINSFASGIGGGGFMLIRVPSNGTISSRSKFEAIDFRETAPRKAHLKMYPNPSLATKGGLSIGVPGEIHGMELAHQLYGKLPWRELFLPIIHMNRNGFRVSKLLSHNIQKYEAWIRINKPWSDIFVRNGTLVSEGGIIKRTNYATTLEQIANHGADAFYKGPIAHSLANFVQEQGGVLDLMDLRNYRSLREKAIHINYRGMDVFSASAPASGHLLLFMLNVMETFQKKNVPDGLYYHRMVESLRYAFAKRSELGDPKFFNLTSLLSELLNKEAAFRVKLNISDITTFPPTYYSPKYYTSPSHGTSHVSVVDERGMAVSFTSTINLPFGSLLMDPSSGIILNNEVDDFSFPNFNNSFGIPPSPINFLAPLKRPMSSMCPAIVEYQNELKIVIGGSGGSHILSAVFQTLMYMLDFHWSATGSVSIPRFHDQLLPDFCELENEFPGDFAEALTMRHHRIHWLPEKKYKSVVQAIYKRRDGTLEAVSDFRKDGKPSGY